MTDPLAPAKDVLLKFNEQIRQKKEIWKAVENGLIASNDESNIDSWNSEEAYCWIFADPEYYFLMGNEYKKPLPDIPIAKKKAKPY